MPCIASRINGAVVEIVKITEIKLKIWGFVEGDNGGWVVLVDMKTGKWNVRFLSIDSEILIQGWLDKEGWFNRSYKSRFFILTAKTEIGMHGRAPFGFFLKCERRQWFFAAQDWQKLRHWTQEIESLIDFARSQQAILQGQNLKNDLAITELSDDPEITNISFFNIHNQKKILDDGKPLKVTSIGGRISPGLNELVLEYS